MSDPVKPPPKPPPAPPVPKKAAAAVPPLPKKPAVPLPAPPKTTAAPLTPPPPTSKPKPEPEPEPESPDAAPPPPVGEVFKHPVIEPPLTPPRASYVKRVSTWVELAKERTKDKPRWFLPVVSGGGALVLLILVVAAGKAACGGSSSSQASAATATSAQVVATPSAAPAQPPAPPAPARMICSSAGPQRRIAPKALAASGVEVRVVGSEIAVGFAPTPNDGTLELLDPSSLATAATVHARSRDPIRRVVALSRSKAKLDVDHEGDPLRGRRTLVADPPIDVGETEDGVGWAPHQSNAAIKLWSLPEPGPRVEAIRGDTLPDGKGFAIAFRRGGDVFAGAFAGSPPAPLGGLARIDGLGVTPGAPAIAASGDRVMVAWSDRASDAKPWSLRTASFRLGEDKAQARTFTPPPGGVGEQAMSPDLTSLGDGRVLLVWTEGLATHQVRAAALDGDGSAIDAFAVSPAGVDAGQGQAATLADGRGVIAFLSSTPRDFYETVAVPIKCEAKP